MSDREHVVFDMNEYDEDWRSDPEDMEPYPAHDLIEEDRELEVDSLKKYLAGEMECIDGKPCDTACNRLLVRGSTGLWDGQRSGFSPYDDLDAALDTSPSRFCAGNIMADCVIDKIWEEEGALLVTGFHHDGRTTIEIRQLTDAGQAALETVEEAWVGEPFTIDGIEYDGTPESMSRAVADIWNNEDMAPRLNYLKRAYGTGLSKEEYDAARKSALEAQAGLESLEAGARVASEAGHTAEEVRCEER